MLAIYLLLLHTVYIYIYICLVNSSLCLFASGIFVSVFGNCVCLYILHIAESKHQNLKLEHVSC